MILVLRGANYQLYYLHGANYQLYILRGANYQLYHISYLYCRQSQVIPLMLYTYLKDVLILRCHDVMIVHSVSEGGHDVADDDHSDAGADNDDD